MQFLQLIDFLTQLLVKPRSAWVGIHLQYAIVISSNVLGKGKEEMD